MPPAYPPGMRKRLKPLASVTRILLEFLRSLPALFALLWLPLILIAATAVALEWLFEGVLRRSQLPELAFQLATAPLTAMSGVLLFKFKLLDAPVRSINLDLSGDTWVGSVFFALADLASAGVAWAAVQLVVWLALDHGFGSQAFWYTVTVGSFVSEALMGAITLAFAYAALLVLVMRRVKPVIEIWQAIGSQIWPIVVVALTIGAVLKAIDVAYNAVLLSYLGEDTRSWLFDPVASVAAQSFADNLLVLPLNFVLVSLPAIATAKLFSVIMTTTRSPGVA